MTDANGGPHTAHTTNRVPLIFVDPQQPQRQLQAGILADLAPTILELLNVPPPAAMTGRSLLGD